MGLDVVQRTFFLIGEAAMRRPVQVLCIAAAVLAAGGTLWAIASSDLIGRYVQLSSQQPSASNQQKLAAIPKAPTTAPAAPQQREELSIEVARIDAGGSSVFAGRSPPDHRVTVLANGREIGSTIATEDGQWAIVIDGNISAGPLELGIKSRSVDGAAEVIGSPRQLVVPGTPVAEADSKTAASRSGSPPPARIVSAAPSGTSGSPAASTSTARTAPQPLTQPAQAAQPKGAQASDQKALDQFAAIVARERQAAAARERDAAQGAGTTATPTVPPASAALATAPPKGQETVAATSKMAAAMPPPHRQDAVDSEPGRLAASRRTESMPIPVPITFVSGEARLTPNGTMAATLLAEYLRIVKPASITLSGHADARGPDGYNMRLSLRRLEAIQRYLRAAGYSGGLSLTPRGKRDPYQGIDRRRLTLNEMYQADRRVELRMTP